MAYPIVLDLKDRLIVVPSVCLQRLPSGFAQRVKDEGGVLIRKTDNRDEIIATALEPVVDTLRVPSNLNSALAPDFLALGYCYLQIELLTRQMRYASNLDETYFKTQTQFNESILATYAVFSHMGMMSREWYFNSGENRCMA